MVNVGSYNFDVPPANVFSWKIGVEGEVKNVLTRLRSKLFLIELRTVADGLRRVATWHVTSRNVDGGLKVVADLGLIFYPIRRAKMVNGFAHRFYDVAPNEPYTVYGVVCKDVADCKEFVIASEKGDHEVIGELLGYPKCDVDFFNEVWVKKGVVDPVAEQALRTDGSVVAECDCGVEKCVEIKIPKSVMRPENNVVFRYFGWRIVPHLPCSFDCDASAEFGRKFLEYLDEDERKVLVEFLSMPFIWDNRAGVLIVQNDWVYGVANSHPYKGRVVVKVV